MAVAAPLKGPFVVVLVASSKVDVVCQLTRRAICRIRVDVALSLITMQELNWPLMTLPYDVLFIAAHCSQGSASFHAINLDVNASRWRTQWLFRFFIFRQNGSPLPSFMISDEMSQAIYRARLKGFGQVL